MFVIFKMAAAAMLDFQKFEILTDGRLEGAKMRHLENFIKIGVTVAEIWRFNCFSKWRPSAILDLLGAYWDQPWWLLGGFYRVQKLVWTDAVVLTIWILNILRVCLKTPIHAPKLFLWCGDAFPIKGVLVATYLLSVEALPHCRCGVANKSCMVWRWLVLIG